MEPNFSAFPWERLRRLTRREAEVESLAARWLAAKPMTSERLAKLAGARGGVRASVVAPSASFDAFAARCEVRRGGASIEVRGASIGVRAIAQRVLGGPAELAAPRPLGVAEKSLWALVVATALEDLGIAGEVWPILDDELSSPRHFAGHAAAAAGHAPTQPAPTRAGHVAAAERANRPLHVHHVAHPMSSGHPDDMLVELAVTIVDVPLSVQLHAADLELRVPPARTWPAWFDTTSLECPVVLGRCALHRDELTRLAVRSVITLERAPAAGAGGNAELVALDGAVGMRVSRGALAAEVTTGYLARDMSLPDEAHVELTVALGTTQLTLRQLGELAVGQIIQLGRPLAGPFELRAAGRVVGRGELVDVDGELAVRIVSLGD